MKKRFIVTLPLVLIWLGLNTVLAQQPSPAPAQPAPRTPQLTSDDLETAPAPRPAEEVVPVAKAAPAPVNRNAPKSWGRHSYPDLGLSIEFPGNPPQPKAFQLNLPDTPPFGHDMQAQIFAGGEWNMMVMAVSITETISSEDLAEVATGIAQRVGVINPNVAPEPGPNPAVRIAGTLNRQNQTRNFGGRLTIQGGKFFFITIDCLPTNTQGCLDAKRVLESAKLAF